jgi:hypothetical protein
MLIARVAFLRTEYSVLETHVSARQANRSDSPGFSKDAHPRADRAAFSISASSAASDLINGLFQHAD